VFVLTGYLSIVGLGLYDEQDMSLRGLVEAKKADIVYLELYTSLMPALSKESLEQLIGKNVIEVSRSDLEEDVDTGILKTARNQNVCLLIPGDPFVATTHISLRIAAERYGIPTKVIHAASILSAIPGATGLQSYKFGRAVSIPFSRDESYPKTPYTVIRENRIRGLHTLVLLDLDLNTPKIMSIREALSILLNLEKEHQEGVVEKQTLAVGIARLGSLDVEIYAGGIRELLDHDFGSPPHLLVFLGDLHFLERDALKALANLSDAVC
jgi:diphthine synthase